MSWLKYKNSILKRQNVVLLAVLIVGLVAGWFLRDLFLDFNLYANHSLRETSSRYKFIYPLLAGADSGLNRDFNDLESILAAKIASQIKANKIINASVYYRDLKDSRWAGVNEDVQYSPASMFKLVTAFSLLKQALIKTDLLDNKVTINFKNKSSQTYTVGQLIKFMLIDSDNSAKDVLESLIKPDERKLIFTDLGLDYVDVNDGGDVISPQKYSIFFRVLFNATYLGPELSERTLSVLADATFKDGLVAGVPKNVVVSHKFGYRVFDDKDPNSLRELHDCGIVYYPNHPYLLCVMTKGTNYDNLKNTIKDLSAIVYDYNLVHYR